MVDTVTSSVNFSGNDKYVITLTNRSDGTGEAAVVKVNLSTLIGPNGIAPTFSNLQEAQWSIQGFSSVQLAWDHTTPDIIDIFAAGNGYRDYRDVSFKTDPRSAGGTGNITLTTFGAVLNATYDITLKFGLRS